jgi:ankyrin repeat protein
MPAPAKNDGAFLDALQGLRDGDFSRLEPLFEEGTGAGDRRALIIQWYEEGRFSRAPDALNEALACACFNGRTSVADYLLTRGVDPSAGTATGMDALHWAANRGQLETVRLLVRRKAMLETRNRFGGTVLGLAVWSALHEPRPDHLLIIEELLRAGADPKEAGYPTGDAGVDALLERHGAA